MATKEVSLKIKVDGKELDLATTSVNQFNQAYSDASRKLNDLPLGSPEWKQLNGELKSAQTAFEQTKDIASTTDGKFKSLKLQIRQTTIALQEAEEKGDIKTFNKLKNDLDDLNDKFEITQLKSMKFTDALATLPGVAGFVGQSFQGLDKAFKLIVANPIIATIGALVGLFTALKESLSRTKEGTEKLAKVGEFLERIMNGLFAIIEPLANILIDFVLGILESKNAMKVFGQIVGVTAGILAGAFNIIKTLTTFVVTNFINAFKTAAGVISGFGDILAGVFTFDFDRIKKGVSKVKDTVVVGFNNTVDNVKDTFKDLTKGTADAFTSAYDAAEKSFSEGYKRQTKRGKELAKNAAEEAEKIKKAKQDEINANEALQQSEDELAEARRKKSEDRLTELQAQQAFLDKSYNREKKRLKDLLALEKEGSNDYKNLQAQINALETKYAQDSENLAKQVTEEKKKQYEKNVQNFQKSITEEQRIRDDAYKKELDDLAIKQAKGEISDLQYNIALRQKNIDQAAQRLMDLQDQRKKEEEFYIDQYSKGLMNKEDYNNKLNELDKTYGDQEYALKTQQGDAIVQQQIFLADTLKQVKESEKEALIDLEQSKLNAIATLGGILGQLAGENKGLAVTALLIEQAAAVAEVLTRSARTKADLIGKKAMYAALIPNPVTAPIGTAGVAATTAGLATNTISTITSLGAIAAAIGIGIAKITGSGGSEGGAKEGGGQNLGRNYATGGLIGGRRHAQGGTIIEAEAGEAIMTRGAVTMFAPLLSAMNQAGGGVSFGGNLVTRPDAASVSTPSMDKQPVIMKTYVVESELTSEQQRQARLKDLSTL